MDEMIIPASFPVWNEPPFLPHERQASNARMHFGCFVLLLHARKGELDLFAACL